MEKRKKSGNKDPELYKVMNTLGSMSKKDLGLLASELANSKIDIDKLARFAKVARKAIALRGLDIGSPASYHY